MNIKNWREGRTQLVRDSLLAIGARMGHLDVRQINDLPEVSFQDGWKLVCVAVNGVGNRIKHLVDVTVTSDLGDKWRFAFDVLGSNQTKNCTFSAIGDVSLMDSERFSDLCFLPEVFADYVAGLLEDHYVTKAENNNV